MRRASSPTCRSTVPPLAPSLPSLTVRRTCPIERPWESRTRIVPHVSARKPKKHLPIFEEGRLPDGTRRPDQKGLRADLEISRDFELRFTVHESPDYLRLKVSVFNDDKRTDLIGEAWVDLNNLIIPGGSQNDHWHTLQCRGKYAGEIRIEMTYYDTREKDEAVIERRRGAAERLQSKASNSTASAASGLSGPRELRESKRRHLPTDPTGATAPRTLENAQSGPPPLHHPIPSRPAIRDHISAMPPVGAPEHISYVPNPPEHPYDALHPARGGYDVSDDYQCEWDNSAPPPLPPPTMARGNTQEPPYPCNTLHDSRPLPQRSHSDYDYLPPRGHRSIRQDGSFEAEMHGWAPYEAISHPHDPQIPMEQPRDNSKQMSYGAVQLYSPRSSGYGHEVPPADFAPPTSSGPVEDPRYLPQNTRLLPPISRPDYHPEYAAMQPRVEDEEEEGLPPPPPVHRSQMAQLVQQPAEQSPPAALSKYDPLYPGNSRAPRDPMASNMPILADRSHFQEVAPESQAAAMPPSLVVGYEPESTGGEPGRAVFDNRAIRRRSSHFDDEMMISQPPAPAAIVPAPVPYEAPVHPLRKSPQPLDEGRSSIGSRGGSASPDTRGVARKSASPQPPASGRGGSIPFSPDSYDSLNPKAGQPGSRDPFPGYESSARADSELRELPVDMDPIIGDDGREIDPSDHLPAETWAPEPEKKNRKPEVIIRFKHSARPTPQGNDTPRNAGPPRVGFREPVSDRPSKRYIPTHTHVHAPDPMDRTPPRGLESHGSYTHTRGYSTTALTPGPRSSNRGSVSPSLTSRAPLYDYSPGSQIPSKAPVTQAAPGYPVMSTNPNSGNPGMDALSRELQTINIGSAGCSPGRTVRKYAPRSATMGYAN